MNCCYFGAFNLVFLRAVLITLLFVVDSTTGKSLYKRRYFLLIFAAVIFPGFVTGPLTASNRLFEKNRCFFLKYRNRKTRKVLYDYGFEVYNNYLAFVQFICIN